MKRYEDLYKNISTKTVDAIRTLVKVKRFYRKTETEKEMLLQELNSTLSDIYKIERPEVRFVPEIEGLLWLVAPRYNRQKMHILLRNTSIVSFLHEYKHHMQEARHKPNNETVARGWSLSLFKQALPKLFEKSAKEGKISFVGVENHDT